MALEDYDPTGFFQQNDFLSPAMGKMFAQNPEAMIPHLAAQGIGPPGPQFAENFAGRFGATSDAQPSVIPPPNASPGSSTAFGGLPNPDWSPTAPLVPPQSTKIQGQIAPSTPGRVPPEALGKTGDLADTGDLRTEGPYAGPPKQLDVVNPDGSPATPSTPEAAAGTVPTPPAKSTPMSPELKKMVDAISGVRPPPAPPTPVLHPEVGKAAAPMAGSPIASMLAEILSGKGVSSNTLRLLQAVGK